ncbi:MAG: hypothetical protein KC635_00120 [Myxococcales bacterium]|nr:hypothetical protein [Myxococcales bacterium]
MTRLSHPSRLALVLLAALALPLAAACGSDAPPDDGGGRVTIETDADALGDAVDTTDAEVDVESASAANAILLAPEPRYDLTLVAQVSPPEVAGEPLQATAVDFDGARAVVSYNLAGPVQAGAVDVFGFDGAATPVLSSRATFGDADVNAVSAAGGRVFLATATSDEGFGTPAVVETLAVDDAGKLALAGHARGPLASYAATSVLPDGPRAFATSGDTGGVYLLDAATLDTLATTALDDARWVARADADHVVVAQGTPGRLTVLDTATLTPTATFPFDGSHIPESKGTVAALGGLAYVAAGDGGALVVDLATGAKVAEVPVPLDLPFPASALVANAVTVDDDLVFVSFGAGGVFMVQADRDLAAPYVASDPPVFTLVGRLVIPGDVASVNHIAYKDGHLFVASGRGGLQIIRVDPIAPPPPPAVGYPYASGFDSTASRAGWAFEGDWGFGAGGEGDVVARSGGVFLDSNPAGLDQYGHGGENNVTFETAFAVPSAGVPVVDFWYTLDLLHASDAVYLQVQDQATGTWSTQMTLQLQHATAAFAHHEVTLQAFAGKTVKLRFRQKMAAAHGARRFVVDDLRIGSRPAATLAYPFAVDFADGPVAAAEAFDTEGIWAFAPSDDGDGGDALVAVEAAGDPRRTSYQAATMRDFVTLPAGGHAVVGFWYRSDLLAEGDRVDVDLQRIDETQWRDLGRFYVRHDRGAWSYREIPLDAHAGMPVRVRFELATAVDDGPRRFEVGGVRIGGYDEPTWAFPWSAADEGASAWFSEGSLRWADDGAGGVLDANPAGASQPSCGDGHEALMAGFVPLPADTAGLALRFSVDFAPADGSDRLRVDLQTRDDAKWREIDAFSSEHVRDGWADVEVPLDGFAGREVRARIRYLTSASEGVRTARVRGVSIGGVPTARWAFPYGADFDDALRAGWALSGAWAIGAGDGGSCLDANPEGLSQATWSDGHQALMTGMVPVPAGGAPVMLLAISNQLVDPGDRVILEIQADDDGRWRAERVYTAEHDFGEAFHWDEVPLAGYAGRAIRARFRFAMAATPGARRFRVDQLRVEQLALPTVTTPFSAGFETAEGRSAWSLWGGFRIASGHGDVAPATGAAYLDGNPSEAVQSGYDNYEWATLDRWVEVPAEGVTYAWFSHRFAPVAASDWVRLEIARESAPFTWASLGNLTAAHASAGWSRLEVPLNAYAGERVRFRFRQNLGASEGPARIVALDDLAVGPLTLPYVAPPLAMDFAADAVAAAALFDLHGSFAVVDGRLDANPDGADQQNYGPLQSAVTRAWIDLRQASAPTLAIRMARALTDAGDRVYLDAQREGEANWRRIATWTPADDGDGSAVQTISLSSQKGYAVRLRLSYDWANTAGARHVTVASASVVDAP